MTKNSDFCKLKSRTSELERCKLPKTCYLTCELVEGSNAGRYRRVANFGGGDNVQSQGMSAFTGTNPNSNSQPWLGNAQGAIVASSGAGHFFDRSGGRQTRERMSHEAYIYIPSEHVQPVDEIRFLSVGEQFSQVRITPAGGNLNAATVVGQVSYLGPPNTRQIGGVVPVNQDAVYGILAYVIDRQDNADTRIQYRVSGGAWVNMPLNWLYPNLADAAQAQSLDTTWCVQGGIGTNDIDDRRLTEVEIQNLGVSSEVVPCAIDSQIQSQLDDIISDIDKITDSVKTIPVDYVNVTVSGDANILSAQNGLVEVSTVNLSSGTGSNAGAGNRYTVNFPAHPKGTDYQWFATPVGIATTADPNGKIPQEISRTATSVTFAFYEGDDGNAIDDHVDTDFHFKVTGGECEVYTPSV